MSDNNYVYCRIEVEGPSTLPSNQTLRAYQLTPTGDRLLESSETFRAGSFDSLNAAIETFSLQLTKNGWRKVPDYGWYFREGESGDEALGYEYCGVDLEIVGEEPHLVFFKRSVGRFSAARVTPEGPEVIAQSMPSSDPDEQHVIDTLVADGWSQMPGKRSIYVRPIP